MAKSPLQLRLPLREKSGWGGRRVGAGRKLAPGRRDPHRKRPSLAARFPCLVTLKVRRDVPSLRGVRVVREIEGSLRALVERTEFRVIHYSIQRNHVHAIVEATSTPALARGMKSLGARLARAANRIFGRQGPVLSDRFHLRILRTPRAVRNALAYVLLNARKHWMKRRGFAPPVRLDEASSARWFTGWRRAPPGRAPRPLAWPPEVAPAHTWLLAQGWRRHGLIDPAEVPSHAGRGASMRATRA